MVRPHRPLPKASPIAQAASIGSVNEYPDPDVTLTLAGGYWLQNLRRLVTDLQPIWELQAPSIVWIDARRLSFMGPAALALTLATLRSRSVDGLLAEGSRFTLPNSLGIRTYLERMDFLHVLFEDMGVRIAPVGRKPTEGLRECSHFVSEDETRAVAKDLSDALGEKVKMDEVAAVSLRLCLSELAENVGYHADTPHGGFAAAQAFSSAKEIEVAIVDLGVGIQTSLAKNPEYREEAQDDVTAIQKAIEPTVTSTPDRNSGYGLAFTELLLQANGGRLIVRSGRGVVQVGDTNLERREAESLPGTLVALRLRTDEPFDFNTAYELLEQAVASLEGTPDDGVRLLRDSTS